MTIITPDSGHVNGILEEADVLLLGIGVLSQRNQHKRLVGYIGPERERGNLRPYVTKREVNLCDCDLLQLRNMQFKFLQSQKRNINLLIFS